MMRALIPALALGATLTGCSALLQQAQGGPTAGEYLNLKADTAYVYAITARHDRFADKVVDIGTATETVLRLTRDGGVTRAEVRMVQRFALPELQIPTSEDATTIEDRGDAVVQVDLDGTETIVLKRPVKVGDSWSTDGATTRVAGYEDIDTQYRPFKRTVRIETTFDGSSTTTWLDREVGMVKFSMHDPQGMHLDYELVDIRGLTAATE